MTSVDISNAHNLNQPATATAAGKHGIRVSLPPGDPFARLLDDNWCTLHWFNSPASRDAALSDMRRRHEYSRSGDNPTPIFEAVSHDDRST